ncbi:MAG: family peptidase [Bradyrhizobium sp.]|nr:family peptidase [Bradyrhizobium sp.]
MIIVRRGALCVGLLLLSGASPAERSDPSNPDAATKTVIREAIERPRVSGSWVAKPQFDVSRDRRRLVYAVETPDSTANIVNTDLWIADLSGGAAPRRLLRVRGSDRGVSGNSGPRTPLPVNPSFSPDGNSIAVTAFGSTGAMAIIDARSGSARLLAPTRSIVFQDAAWSPDGKQLAATYQAGNSDKGDRGVEVDTDWNGKSLSHPTTRIAVIDVATDIIVATTPVSIDVAGIAGAFSWSPLGGRIAFSGHPSGKEDFDFRDDDIYAFEVRSSTVTPLTAQAGPDLDPRWSPDGAIVAFQSAGGSDTLKRGLQLTFLNLVSGRLSEIPRTNATESPYAVQWLDRNQVSFVAMRRMSCPIFIANARSLNVRQVSPDDLSCMGAAVAGPAEKLISVRHSFGHPAQLVTSPTAHWVPTALGPSDSSIKPLATERIVEWPSADGTLTIHGVLVEPVTHRNKPRPLLVIVAGGPGMVTPDVYNDDGQHLLYPSLLRGYSVLVPNTRGRGGYGAAFAAAISDHQDYMPGPLSDVLGGVDLLIRSGAADPDRVALAGFSYGGVLASYAATRSRRFRAIMAMEGAVDFYSRAIDSFGSVQQANGAAILGFSNPYNPRDQALLLSQSPLTGAASVRTPVLLECGILSLAGSECLKFYRTVHQLAGSEIELIVYPRTGHGIHEPALRYDSAVRQAAWLDRWLGTADRQTVPDRAAVVANQ